MPATDLLSPGPVLDASVAPSAPAILPRTGPIVMMDAPARSQSLYGPIFARLGVTPIHGFGASAEEIMAQNPAAILLSSEWNTEMRLTAAAARRANIPVIYVVDGAMEWSYLWNNLSWIRPTGTNLQPLIGSDLCVFGQHQARIFASMGLARRLHIIGLPRLDGVSRDRVIATGSRPRLVVATSRTAGHDVEQQAMVMRALRDLRTWFAAHAEIDVIWRIAADLAEDLGVSPDIEGEISEVLARASALISLPSTCLLEGMHKGIPVAQLEYRAVPLYTATAWEIRCAEHISSVVHELLYPPPSKLAWQDACFADELELGDATGRLAQVIRDALADPDPYAEASRGQPVRVQGRLDYRQIYSELSAFAMSDTSVLQYELSAVYTALRQAKVEKGQIRQDCLALTEAVVGHDVRHARVFSFLDWLASGKATVAPPGKLAETNAAIGGPNARALLMAPPADVGFTLPTGSAGKLSFAISLAPDVWANPHSGPCRFAIQANGKAIFETTLNQLANPASRKWCWFTVAVPANAAGGHTIQFTTRGVGGDALRWALWRHPVFLWVEPDPNANEGFLPRAALGGTYYVPGRSVA